MVLGDPKTSLLLLDPPCSFPFATGTLDTVDDSSLEQYCECQSIVQLLFSHLLPHSILTTPLVWCRRCAHFIDEKTEAH